MPQPEIPRVGRAGRDEAAGELLVRDVGQAAVLLVLVVLALGVATSVALAEFGSHLVDRTSAQHAADAAALAGVEGGRTAAARLAAINGGELVSFVAGNDEVTVVVRVGSSRATARASRAVDQVLERP